MQTETPPKIGHSCRMTHRVLCRYDAEKWLGSSYNILADNVLWNIAVSYWDQCLIFRLTEGLFNLVKSQLMQKFIQNCYYTVLWNRYSPNSIWIWYQMLIGLSRVRRWGSQYYGNSNIINLWLQDHTVHAVLTLSAGTMYTMQINFVEN